MRLGKPVSWPSGLQESWNMSDESQDTQTPLQNQIDWVAKHWARVRLGHEGVMLDKIHRQARIVEQLAQNQMTGDMGNTDAWPGHEGDDDMGVNIGDHIHYHAPPEQPSEPAAAQPVTPTQPTEPVTTSEPVTPAHPVQTEETPQPPSSRPARAIWPYALAAALTGGGLGAAAAALPVIWRDNAPQPTMTDTDTDTQYELRISSGELNG
jgi:hypothetical protein